MLCDIPCFSYLFYQMFYGNGFSLDFLWESVRLSSVVISSSLRSFSSANFDFNVQSLFPHLD
jgi:hypothetical protein